MFDVDIPYSDEASEDTSIDHDYAALDEEDVSGLVGSGVTEEVGYMQKFLNSSSFSSYMLKPSQLLPQGFGNNRTAQEKLFKHMCNVGSRAEWKNGRRVGSSYLDVDTTKYQCRLLNPTPLDYIAGYITNDAVGKRALDTLLQIRMNFIDGSISSYCYILNLPKQLEQISQANKFASIMCDLESDCMRENE